MYGVVPASVVPAPVVPAPITQPHHRPVPTVPTRVAQNFHPQQTPALMSRGISSSSYNLPMLSSYSQPWWRGVVSTPTVCSRGGVASPGWPEARPLLDGKSDSPQLINVSTSGFQNLPSLSPSLQFGVNNALPVFQQQHPPVTPAYCFHCLQFGSVFTINPV